MTNDPLAILLIAIGTIGLVTFLVSVILFFWVLKKMGRTPWWGVLLFVPFVNIVMYWIFAFWRWPSVDGYRYAAMEFD